MNKEASHYVKLFGGNKIGNLYRERILILMYFALCTLHCTIYIYAGHRSSQKSTPLCINGDRGSTVVNVLCYKSEGRWFDPIDIKSLRSHYGPGVDSASNINEYQENFLEVKAAGA